LSLGRRPPMINMAPVIYASSGAPLINNANKN
jgi:hypothetical protein